MWSILGNVEKKTRGSWREKEKSKIRLLVGRAYGRPHTICWLAVHTTDLILSGGEMHCGAGNT